MAFNEKIYFDMVRQAPFGGSMSQEQVDGQRFILASWDRDPTTTDLRWLAYGLATTKHETASTMLPIEEYGRGQGKEYGKKDPVTGQTYYGRGFVQLTWRDNYKKADLELGLTGDKSCEWHASNALKPDIAADIMFLGMAEGWFRGDSKGRQTLLRYFDFDTDDSFGAREIVNGDKHIVPKWSGGKNIGTLIADYHEDFHAALVASYVEPPVVVPEPPDLPQLDLPTVHIVVSGDVVVTVNGKVVPL